MLRALWAAAAAWEGGGDDAALGNVDLGQRARRCRVARCSFKRACRAGNFRPGPFGDIGV